MKLHPHLTNFIRSVASTELHDTPHKQAWKDSLIREVLESMDFKGIRTQDELDSVVELGMDKFRTEKLEPSIELLTAILKKIPLEFLK